MKVVLFLGYSGSGKTSTIEYLTRAITKKGWRVGTLKHIHHRNFTIDTPGKDSWRHAAAGASTVVSLASNELTVIRKIKTRTVTPDRILNIFEEAAIDIVLVEGLYRKFRNVNGTNKIFTILCAASKRELLDLMKQHKHRITCISGNVTDVDLKSRKYFHGIPLMRFPKDTSRFLKVMELS